MLQKILNITVKKTFHLKEDCCMYRTPLLVDIEHFQRIPCEFQSCCYTGGFILIMTEHSAFSSVQVILSPAQLPTPWTAAHEISQSFTISLQLLFQLMSIESVAPIQPFFSSPGHPLLSSLPSYSCWIWL